MVCTPGPVETLQVVATQILFIFTPLLKWCTPVSYGYSMEIDPQAITRWWQLKYLFIFTPDPWGRWTHFDDILSNRLKPPVIDFSEKDVGGKIFQVGGRDMIFRACLVNKSDLYTLLQVYVYNVVELHICIIYHHMYIFYIPPLLGELRTHISVFCSCPSFGEGSELAAVFQWTKITNLHGSWGELSELSIPFPNQTVYVVVWDWRLCSTTKTFLDPTCFGAFVGAVEESCRHILKLILLILQKKHLEGLILSELRLLKWEARRFKETLALFMASNVNTIICPLGCDYQVLVLKTEKKDTREVELQDTSPQKIYSWLEHPL